MITANAKDLAFRGELIYGFRLLSVKSTATDNASRAFAEMILTEIKGGYGFVPLLGAGFSVSAGIPILNQFSSYLQRCIAVAVGAETDSAAPQLWNPRTDDWPPFIDLARPEPPATSWKSLVYKKYRNEAKKNPNGAAIYQEAWGAMAEWRTSLSFLSRITLDKPRAPQAGPEHSPKPVLGMPNQSVIDACLRQVLRASSPSLNHTMLATLSQLLRIDTILTTNFDNLVEKAFASSRNTLEVLDVHLGDKLPDFDTVSRARSIIKLHGSKNSMRADYSLDSSAAVEDRQMFASYIAGRKLNHIADGDKGTRNHLIVFGVGMSELRTKSFFIHSLDSLPDMKIFFVCYNEAEIAAVWAFVEEYFSSQNEHGRRRDPKKERCVVVRHTESGLLLLHIYQVIRRSLPPGDAIFPSSTRLSLPPLPQVRQAIHEDSGYKNIFDEMRLWIDRIDIKKHQLLIATSARGVIGVGAACAELFRKYEGQYLCLWLELHDIHDADDLFEAFQETAYRRLGERDWTPLYAAKDQRPRDEEIQRIANSSAKPLLIFLNARETPGANRRDFTQSGENGWLDGAAEQKRFVDLMRQLTNPQVERPGRIRVVLLCRGKLSSIEQALNGCTSHVARLEPAAEKLLFTESEVTYNVLQWVEAECVEGDGNFEREKLSFLLGLISLQRTRYFSIAWDRCVNSDENPCPVTDQYKETWLLELETLHLLHRKDGGFIWLDASFRTQLRRCLALKLAELAEPVGVIREKIGLELDAMRENRLVIFLRRADASSQLAEIHRNIAMWYLKLFDSSGTTRSVLEAIDHLCLSVDCLLRYNLHPSEYFGEATTRIDRARQLLTEHMFQIQTEGHPRSTIRRLDYIRDYWQGSSATRLNVVVMGYQSIRGGSRPERNARKALMKAIAKLQCCAAEVSRAISREIGEDGDAYERQREIAIRTVVDVPIPLKTVKKRESRFLDRGTTLNIQLEYGLRKYGDRRHHWIRWWRWCGMLGCASRSLQEAKTSMAKALAASTLKLGSSYALTNVPFLEDWPVENLELNFEKNQHKHRLETLHSIEMSAVTLLLEAQTIGRMSILKIEHDMDSKRDSLTNQAERIASRGIELIKNLQSRHCNTEDHDFDILWCKSRLLMASAMSAKSNRSEYHTHAMSLLSDAAACLRSAIPERNRADIALIELRRADVRLREAAELKLDVMPQEFMQLNSLPFERWTIDRLIGDSIDTPLEEMKSRSQLAIVSDLKTAELRGRSEEELVLRDSLSDSLRKISARATDALRFLDRALPILIERRRNVWWASWYFERRLRAISFLLWTSVFDEGQPIPVVGLEAAMRKTDTEADVLLKDAVRMIRVDSYRLSMVLLSYASCARALQIRMRLESRAVFLSHRLEGMRSNLVDAIEQLKEAHKRREPDFFMRNPSEGVARNSDSHKASLVEARHHKEEKASVGATRRREILEKGRVDNSVEQIVNEVIKRAQNVCDGIQLELELRGSTKPVAIST